MKLTQELLSIVSEAKIDSISLSNEMFAAELGHQGTFDKLAKKIGLTEATKRPDLMEGYKEVKQKFISAGTPIDDVSKVLSSFKDLVDRNQVKGDERNIDWWGKKSFDEFKSFVDDKVREKSKTQIKRKKITGKSINLIDNEDWLVVIPLDKDASCFYGKHSDWCTTKANQAYFEKYFYDKDVILIYCLNKKTGGMWAISAQKDLDETELFDKNDKSINKEEFKNQTGLDSKKLIDLALSHYSKIDGSKKPYREALVRLESVKWNELYRRSSQIESDIVLSGARMYYGSYLEAVGDDASEEAKLAAVKAQPSSIQFLEHPSETIQLAAVRGDGSCIEFIDKPSEAVQLAALEEYFHSIHNVPDTNEVLKIAIDVLKKIQPSVITQFKKKHKVGLSEANGIFEPVTDADIRKDNETLVRRGGVLKKNSNGTFQVITDGDKTLRQAKSRNVTESAGGRSAEQLELGDEVEVTGNVSFKGETGQIASFGKNKKFVVVKLHQGGEHAFHSLDVSEVEADPRENEADTQDEKDKFYIAFYDRDEERSWVGLISKEHGGKWHEKSHRGRPEKRWGQSYMAYLSPSDIMQWIHKDYGRDIEIEGPFDTAKEAEEYVTQNWGSLSEAVKVLTPYENAVKVIGAAYRKILGDKTYSGQELEDIKDAYKALRNALEEDDLRAFKKAWKVADEHCAGGYDSPKDAYGLDALVNAVLELEGVDFEGLRAFIRHFKLKESRDVISDDDQLNESYCSDLKLKANREKRAGNMLSYYKLMMRYSEEMQSASEFNAASVGKISMQGKLYLRDAAKYSRDYDTFKKLYDDCYNEMREGVSTGRAISESLKLISNMPPKEGRKNSAKVYRDTDWDEYRVKFFKNGIHQTKADYHTDDKSDAIAVADHWVKYHNVHEGYAASHKLIDVKTGREVVIGTSVTGPRGKKLTVLGWTPGISADDPGSVETNDGTFEPEVLKTEIVPLIKPYVKKVDEASEREEWGISEKGAGSYNSAGDRVYDVTWYKTRNERHQHAMRLKKQGKDYNTYERTVKEGAASWEDLNAAARVLGAKNFSSLTALDAASLVNFKAANEATKSMFGGLTETRSLAGRPTRFWALSQEQMRRVIQEHPELIIQERLNVINEGTTQTPWDILTKLAERHGVEYFSELTPAQMDEYISYRKASEHALRDFKVKQFNELQWQQMAHIMNKHPEFMKGEAASAYAPEPVEEGARLVPISKTDLKHFKSLSSK